MYRPSPSVVRSTLKLALAAAAAFLLSAPAGAAAIGPAERLTGVDPEVRHENMENCGLGTCPFAPPPAFGAVPTDLTALGDLLFFVAGDEAHGGEPWISGGTEQGTRMLLDVCPGPCSSEVAVIGVLDGDDGPRVFFWAWEPESGAEPWVSDGTTAGTRRIADLCPGECSSGRTTLIWWQEISDMGSGVGIGGRLLFVGSEFGDDHRDTLYASDGTAGGTEALAVLCTESCGWPPPSQLTLAASGDRAWFVVRRAFYDERLWVTDGTPAGTRELRPGCSKDQRKEVKTLIAFLDGVAFVGGCRFADDPDSAWIYRGGVFTDLGVEGARDLAVLDDRLYVLASGALWSSDGTPAGTRPAVALDRGYGSVQAAAGALYMAADVDPEPSAATVHLFATDGAAPPQQVSVGLLNGSRRSGDVVRAVGGRAVWWERPDTGARFDTNETAYEWRLVSHAPESGHREEQVFITDPAAGNVDHQANVAPDHAVAGDDLFLSGNGGGGLQLWSLDAAEVGPPCFNRGDSHCLRQGRFEVRVEVRNQHAGGAERTARPQSASRHRAGDTGHFWFFRPGNLELAVKVLDGRPVNGHWWVFAGGVTDLEYDLVVTDLERDETRTYRHGPGDLCSVVDTAAFAEPAPASAPPAAAPAAEEAPEVCDPVTGSRACVGPGGRFSLSMSWLNQHAGGTQGTAELRAETADTALARFFPRGGVEAMVKVLDGRPVNGHWWVLWGGLTDLGYTLEVRDRESGEVRRFTNPPGGRCGGAATTAFAAVP